jgi:hypothetical protein
MSLSDRVRSSGKKLQGGMESASVRQRLRLTFQRDIGVSCVVGRPHCDHVCSHAAYDHLAILTLSSA